MPPIEEGTDLVFENEHLDEHIKTIAGDKPIAQFALKALNTMLGGIYKGQLYVVGAAPGTGKSTLLLQEADHLASLGFPVLFVSAELSASKLVEKSIVRLSDGELTLENVALAADPTHPLHGVFEAATDAYREQVAPNLCIVNAIACEEIEYLVRSCRKERGQVPIVFIDYLQLVASASVEVGMDERLAIGALVRNLRAMSRRNGSPVIVVSTVARGYYGGKEPSLEAYGGASVIEYDFDAALHLASSANGDGNEDGIRNLVIKALKNRYGPLGCGRVRFNGPGAVFLDRR